MKGIEVNADNENVYITLKKKQFDLKVINNLLDTFEFESSVREADFDPAVVEFGQQLKKNWWKKNKASFLK
jgi:hypothetical protein